MDESHEIFLIYKNNKHIKQIDHFHVNSPLNQPTLFSLTILECANSIVQFDLIRFDHFHGNNSLNQYNL